jgi:hypothetical protein
VAFGHPQEQIPVFGGKLYHIDHNANTPVLSFCPAAVPSYPFASSATKAPAWVYVYFTEKTPCEQVPKPPKYSSKTTAHCQTFWQKAQKTAPAKSRSGGMFQKQRGDYFSVLP